jgi:hypothetical protein
MGFRPLPASAAWRHRDARDGFEVVFPRTDTGGHHLEGVTAAAEDGDAWTVHYAVDVDTGWRTRSAHILGWSARGRRELRLETDGDGSWLVDGTPAPELAGCLDVDLESSVVTNTLPVHRLRLEVGEGADAPAAFVRALDLRVERLEQRYVRTGDEAGHAVYAYQAPRFDYAGRLAYDVHGLLLDYPGIAERVLVNG